MKGEGLCHCIGRILLPFCINIVRLVNERLSATWIDWIDWIVLSVELRYLITVHDHQSLLWASLLRSRLIGLIGLIGALRVL
jgi:hypothetical protein